MKNLFLLSIFFSLSWNLLNAEDLKQTIRGTVIDKDSKTPLAGATVILLGTDPLIATITDFEGGFIIQNVPIGRQSLKISFIGYYEVYVNNILLNSSKEIVLNIELEEKIEELEAVVVKAYNRKDKPVNEMALISARSFTIEETERFAGSLGDPSRMVANYAGVMTQDDSRNDIIIRGNSPTGVIWRLDGIEVPNPNHFGALGTTGGPVSMINNNLLNNSDFFTGAFPAEFGNGISGAFDIRLRPGNNQEREFVGQIGFNGFEVGAEGPFIKGKKASYLANYRYSTLALMHILGFGTNTGSAVPYYQDFTFKLDFPDTRLGHFTVIGLAGLSDIDLVPDTTEENMNAYNSPIIRTKYGSDMGVAGITNLYFFSERTRLESSISLQGTGNKTLVDSLNENLNLRREYYRSGLTDLKISFSTELKTKFNSKNSASGGIVFDIYNVNYIDSAYDDDYSKFLTVTKVDNKQLSLLKGFGQWQHKFSDKITLYSGIYMQYFDLNKEISIEPRLSAQWKFHPKQSFNMGFGRHSQMQPRMVYFTQTYDSVQNKYWETNHDVKFSKSDHYILGYNYLINNDLRLKFEAYYQNLYEIPVSNHYKQFSMLNAGADFSVPSIDSLSNTGRGKNLGLELTFEKFLSKGYYFLLTASVFDSKYKAADKEWRNTAFNGNYVFNALCGYEIKIKNKNFLTVDLKAVWAGGRRYVPYKQEVYDLVENVKNNPDAPIIYFDEIYDDEKSYSLRYKDYLRFDLRIGYKINHKKYSEEFGLDLQNITNYKSLYSQVYNADKAKIVNVYQAGFSPMFLYRIQF